MGYIKQALAMMREEKLYSAMYICGTALAIAFTMLIAEVYYIKTANIAPEVNRSKTYYLEFMWGSNDDILPADITQEDFETLFLKMKTPECVKAEISNWMLGDWYMKLADGVHDRPVIVKLTEPNYFRFYQFSFTEGAPFTQDDFDNERRVAVITEEVREQLFGKEGKGVGKTVRVENRDYRISGVVETPSMLAERCCADIWFPYSADSLLVDKGRDYRTEKHELSFCIPAGKLEAFKKELKEVEARYNAVHKDNPVDMLSPLGSYYNDVWNNTGEVFSTSSNKEHWWYIITAIFMLLFVPALNLSGMVVSRMERRLPEMAIRKAFGAKRRTLLGQIVMENLVLTLIGGFLGLCLAWAALYVFRSWVFYIFFSLTSWGLYGRVPIIEGEMFFAPIIFLITLLICTLLNVLAATLPAWMSLRKPIVESMMIKK
ncbi:MAG: ABC transporter permease [Bacteroidaceae bacterium]|nr:ABC transporter permease [Bacteroidaceae bacterium]